MSGNKIGRETHRAEGFSKPPDADKNENGFAADKTVVGADKTGAAADKTGAAADKTGAAADKTGAAKSGAVPLWMDLLALLAKIGALALAFWALTFFVFGLYRNQDGDMFPAVKDGDQVVFYRLDNRYSASDCIVLDYQGKRQVRRVAAVAGDTVDITEEGLFINGVLQYEPEIYERTFRYEEGCSFPVTLQDGEAFVLGDARDNAVDSRVYGPVKVKDTLGKVMMIIRRRGF